MEWTLPGTVLTARREDAKYVENQFSAMFLGGGISLSQVAAVTGLEPYTVQNWVKRELLPPPKNKRYDLNQLCRIITINMLKNVLSMERICSLLIYINGEMDDTSDDLIDDAALYFLFVRLAANLSVLRGAEEWKAGVDEVLESYAEPIPGAKDRVKNALRIMLTAWAAARMQQLADEMLHQLF